MLATTDPAAGRPLCDKSAANLQALRSRSLLATAMILQAARDLMLPIDVNPELELSNHQHLTRRRNLIHRNSAMQWIKHSSDFDRFIEDINAFLRYKRHDIELTPDRVRQALLENPGAIARIFLDAYGDTAPPETTTRVPGFHAFGSG